MPAYFGQIPRSANASRSVAALSRRGCLASPVILLSSV